MCDVVVVVRSRSQPPHQKLMSTLLVGPSGIISDTRSCVDKYKDVWAKLDESDNFQQRYEVEMGKDVIRPGRSGLL
jgi:hypothetical protein